MWFENIALFKEFAHITEKMSEIKNGIGLVHVESNCIVNRKMYCAAKFHDFTLAKCLKNVFKKKIPKLFRISHGEGYSVNNLT